MTASAGAIQRFTVSSPCPICGGHPRLPRGQGVRCVGYLGSDGQYAHCTREQHAGNLAPDNASPPTYPHRLEGDCRCGRSHGTSTAPTPQARRPAPPLGRPDAVYDYRNADGTTRFLVGRFPVPGPEAKTFRQRLPGSAGWDGLNGTSRVLYRLPELLASDPARTVFVVEGEKDVETLTALKLIATTNPGGAEGWKPELAAPLQGRRVVVIPDNDQPGRKWASRVTLAAANAGATEVRLVTLPDVPEKGDVTDWLNAGHTVAELKELVSTTPVSPATEAEDEFSAGSVDERSGVLAAVERLSSWTPVDVERALAGDMAAMQPTHLWGDLPLLYPGRIHDFHGEAESLKSWAAQVAVAEVLNARCGALYIDYEAAARDVLGHLLLLGVSRERLIEGLIYIRPEESQSEQELEGLLELARCRQPEVAVFDGVDAGMELDGLSPNKEFRRWHSRIVRPLQRLTTGPTILVDHVAKDKETRGDYAAGDRAKRSVIDGAAFGFDKVEEFGHGKVGVARLMLHKDRPGALRGRQTNGKEIARLRLTSHDDGHITWELLSPGTAGAAGAEKVPWQPTGLMEKVSIYLEEEDAPRSKLQVEKNVRGKRDYIRLALESLVDEGYVGVVDGPRNGQLHRSLNPYREDGSAPRPDLAPTSPQEPGAMWGPSSPRGGVGDPVGVPPAGGEVAQQALDHLLTAADLAPAGRTPHAQAVGL